MNKGDVLDNMASFVNHMLRTKTLSCVCVWGGVLLSHYSSPEKG